MVGRGSNIDLQAVYALSADAQTVTEARFGFDVDLTGRKPRDDLPLLGHRAKSAEPRDFKREFGQPLAKRLIMLFGQYLSRCHQSRL